jgi:hypothetical protein
MTANPTSKKSVRALFEASAILFNVDADVTLEQIAALLVAAGRSHGTRLVVDVCLPKV